MSVWAEEFRLILTTAGSDKQAEEIARALVERKLAACVNIVGSTCSIYRWKGEVVRESEKLLLIKSCERLLPQIRETIRELHTYEVPEVLALSIQGGDDEYLSWLAGCLS